MADVGVTCPERLLLLVLLLLLLLLAVVARDDADCWCASELLAELAIKDESTVQEEEQPERDD